MLEGFFRCAHCRGFYEAARANCKWCSYDTPMLGSDGEPVHYPDRETARAVQMSDYEQIPHEIRHDGMGPPPNNLTLVCWCLHCGPGGHLFEAVEMRWMQNERMWACPCTTCGGRGFHFDIYPAEPIWECAECGHWYTPERFTQEFANCPKCGSKYANGPYESDDEEDADWDDDEALFEGDEASVAAAFEPDDAAQPDWEAETQPWYPGKDEDDEAAHGGEPPMPDDIDFPRDFSRDDPRDPIAEDDIPF